MDLAATRGRAGSKFKPKPRPRLRKHVSVSTSQTLSNDANEKLSTQPSVANAVSENLAPTGVNLEKQRCDDKVTHAVLDDPRTQGSEMSGVFASPEIGVQTKSIQLEEEEDRLNMERFKIVQEGTIAYGHHTEKLQLKPRLDGNVIEEENHSVHKEACEPRDEAIDMNANFSADLQEEISPQVPEKANGNSSHGWEHEERVESPSNNNVAGEEKSGRERNVRKSTRTAAEKSRAAQKREKTSEEPNQRSEEPQKKKKFKHSTRRQKRTLEKELLEIPDDEIRFLPIKDLLRLVDYKEWLEKKKAKGQGSKAQESVTSTTSKASDKHYSQDDAENSDEFRESQETSRVKPDSPVNYQTFSRRTARSRWSKQDTELFYEGIREFGSNLSMVQQLFPNLTHQQMKLKYKLEERKHPFKLNDALASRPKHHTHHKNVIKKLQQEAAAQKAEEEEEEAENAGEGAAAAEAETNDVPQNEETERAGDAEPEVKESDGAEAESDQRSSGGDDDDDYWASYTSEM